MQSKKNLTKRTNSRARKRRTKTPPPAQKSRAGLTGHEIQAIIFQSAQSNVQELEVAGLRLRFGSSGPAKEAPPPSLPAETNPPAAAANAEEPEISKEELERQEAEVKEERLALMAIEDPLQFERLVCMPGELRDEGGSQEA